MDHKEEHHLHHRKDREHKKEEQKHYESEQETKIRTIHPGWFVGTGVVLILAVIVIWIIVASR